MKKVYEKELLEKKANLKEMIKIKDSIIMSLNKVSSNGMSRQFSVFSVSKNKIHNITNLVGQVIGLNPKFDGVRDYIVVNGCGMDMAFWLSNAIKTTLFTKAQYKRAKVHHCDGSYCLI